MCSMFLFGMCLCSFVLIFTSLCRVFPHRHRWVWESRCLQSDLHQLQRRLQVRVLRRLRDGPGLKDLQGCGWVPKNQQSWMITHVVKGAHEVTVYTSRPTPIQYVHRFSTPCYSYCTSHTVPTLWGSVKGQARFVCRLCSAICSKINICHLPLQSSLMKSLQPAASALSGVSRQGCCVRRELACPVL